MRISRYIGLVLGVAVTVTAGVWILGGVPVSESASPAGSDSVRVGIAAGAEPGIEVVAEVGGAAGYGYAVAVLDSIAVFSRGPKLVVVNVSEPRSPVMLGSAAMPGEIRDIALAGRFAYVAADSAGVQIVDLGDAVRPTILGSLKFSDRADGVAIDGSLAYVAARSQGLRVMDVSTGSEPEEIGHFVTPDEAVDVVVRDGYAYVAAWYESMRIIDVRDPTALKEVSFASYDSYDNGAAWTVYVEGDIGLNAIPEMGLRTVDISDPHDAKLYKVYRGLFAPAGVAARGKIAFVADQDAGFRVLDLTEPAALVEIGSLDLPGSPLSVVLGGDYAYVAAREGGLRIVDISRPQAPSEVAYVDEDDALVDVAVHGDVVYAAGTENGVYVLEDGGRLVSRSKGAAGRVRFDNGRMVVASSDGVRFYDQSDALPSKLLPGPARGVAVRGELTVTAAGIDGLRLFNGDRQVGGFLPERMTEGPLNREQLLRTPVSSWDVVLEGDLALGAFDDGIRIVDLSTPSSPSIVGSIATPQRVYRLAVHDSRLLAACDDGLRVFDLSTREEIAYIKTPSFATAIAVHGGRAYVGDLSGTLTVVDLGDLPSTTGTYEIADRIYGLAFAGEELAVAAGAQGIRMVRLE